MIDFLYRLWYVFIWTLIGVFLGAILLITMVVIFEFILDHAF